MHPDCRNIFCYRNGPNYYRKLYTNQEIEKVKIDDDSRTTKSLNHETSIPEVLQSEIEHAIRTQKTDKTPGEDNITNEVLKSISEALLTPLQILFNSILIQRSIP